MSTEREKAIQAIRCLEGARWTSYEPNAIDTGTMNAKTCALALVFLLLPIALLAEKPARNRDIEMHSKGIDLLKRRSENPQKMVPDALNIFETLLRGNPDDDKALAGVVYALTLMGGYGFRPIAEVCDQASKYSKKLEAKRNIDPLGQYALGRWNLWCEGSISKAIPYFENASKQHSEFQADSLIALATVHLFRSEESKSKAILKEVRNLGNSPEEQFIWFDLYYRDYDSVIKKTAALLKQNPKHRNALAYRARAYLALGLGKRVTDKVQSELDFKNAEEIFKRLYESSDKPAYNALAEHVIALAFTDRPKAMKEYKQLELTSKRFLEKGKSSPVMYYRLAQIAAALDLHEEAEAHFEAAIKARESMYLWIGIDPVMKQLTEKSSRIKSKMVGLGLRSN